MKCGVKFCGGCNPGYDRGKTLEEIKDDLKEHDIEFNIATEEEIYDDLLVIGGCTSCCASHDQYKYTGKLRKMWSAEHKEKIIDELKK